LADKLMLFQNFSMDIYYCLFVWCTTADIPHTILNVRLELIGLVA